MILLKSILISEDEFSSKNLQHLIQAYMTIISELWQQQQQQNEKSLIDGNGRTIKLLYSYIIKFHVNWKDQNSFIIALQSSQYKLDKYLESLEKIKEDFVN